MDAKICCSICLKENSDNTMDDPDNLVTFTNCCQQPLHISCLEQWFLSCIQNGWDETCPYCRHLWDIGDEGFWDTLELEGEEGEEDDEELDWTSHIIPQLNAFLELVRINNLDNFQNKAALIYILDICQKYLEQNRLVRPEPPPPGQSIDLVALIDAQIRDRIGFE